MTISFKPIPFILLGLAVFGNATMNNVTMGIAANSQSQKPASQVPAVGLSEVKNANWWEEGENEPIAHLIVNIAMQTVSVYSNGKLVSKSNVSTGKKGHETPGGIFSILSKNRTHFSNIYSRAPMPFMQRMTWSGIALHGSKSVPDYPASHGCVRLPGAFASQLFKYTRRGAQVIVTSLDVSPEKFSSPDLFSIGIGSKIQSNALRPSLSALPVVASIGKDLPVVSQKPLRVLLTRNSGREKLTDIQNVLNELGYSAGEADGWMGPQTGKAIRAFQSDYDHKITGALSTKLQGQLYRASGRGKPKNGHVYVRLNKKPLFDMAVVLADEKVPLGTHHFAAVVSHRDEAGTTQQSPYWLATSIEQTGWAERDEGDFTLPSSAKRALARFELPDELKQKISSMITHGSTVSISDQGLSIETISTGTDFIVLTK